MEGVLLSLSRLDVNCRTGTQYILIALMINCFVFVIIFHYLVSCYSTHVSALMHVSDGA